MFTPDVAMNAERKVTRRRFVKTAIAATAGLAVDPPLHAASEKAFSFVLLGDLHFDRLAHHDLDWLRRERPDDFRQVQNYSRLTVEILPKLFSTVRETVAGLNRSPTTRVPFVLHVGDLVEGLCGSEKLAVQQDTEAIAFLRGAKLGAPFLFSKGNHDITGDGAADAFKNIFHPFLGEQARHVDGAAGFANACYSLEHGDAAFHFFDAYEKQSLDWLEAALARCTARHCFAIVHPPVVPYGARSTWHVFSSERDRTRRERFLDLLGKHNAFALTGHIHKYNLLSRATPRGGKFVQLAISSIINAPDVKPKHQLAGVQDYNADQVKVEPDFSPATEPQRRAVYETEASFVKQFEYADLPGYAVVAVNGPAVTAKIYSGVSREVWRTVELAKAL